MTYTTHFVPEWIWDKLPGHLKSFNATWNKSGFLFPTEMKEKYLTTFIQGGRIHGCKSWIYLTALSGLILTIIIAFAGKRKEIIFLLGRGL